MKMQRQRQRKYKMKFIVSEGGDEELILPNSAELVLV